MNIQEAFLVGLFALICVYTICTIADIVKQFKDKTTCSVDTFTVVGSMSGMTAVVLMLIAHYFV